MDGTATTPKPETKTERQFITNSHNSSYSSIATRFLALPIGSPSSSMGTRAPSPPPCALEVTLLVSAPRSLPDAAFGTWFSWYHAYNQSGAEARCHPPCPRPYVRPPRPYVCPPRPYAHRACARSPAPP